MNKEMNKIILPSNEEETKNFIVSPQIKKSGWIEGSEIRYEYNITDGRFNCQSDDYYVRQLPKKADIVLMVSGKMLAIIEVKSYNKTSRSGIHQAEEYCKMSNCPFAFSTNGQKWIFKNLLNGEQTEISIDKFPTKEELIKLYNDISGNNQEQKELIFSKYYYNNLSKKEPRYYQRIAVEKTLLKIADGCKRILLVMATGTGKTFTAFQIIYKILESQLMSKKIKKILYLADRNALIDQTIAGDFAYYNTAGIVYKISDKNIKSGFKIYFGLYQQLVSNDGNNNPYETLNRDFFDLIIVDECHRGSAKDDSTWRQILDYFSSAIQIGLTATPKESKDVSNTDYFGEPVYVYSLKQGIDDGFLSPYEVYRVNLDIDIDGYIPNSNDDKDIDQFGNKLNKNIYNKEDFGNVIDIRSRSKTIAHWLRQFMESKNIRRYKTIVFCEGVPEAEIMKECLVNENIDICKQNNNYVSQITGDIEYKSLLDDFISPKKECPTIVTTSELLSTGIDCKTCKIIVLNKNINSMIMFKQIIGRGTRIDEKNCKNYFYIIDFKGATKNFYDSSFDGEPEKVYEIKTNEVIKKKSENNVKELKSDKEFSYKPEIEGRDVTVISEVRQTLENNKLITRSYIDKTKQKFNEKYNLSTFLNHWNEEERKSKIGNELKEMGIELDELKTEIRKTKKINVDELDSFDIICHIAFDKKPITKKERVNNLKKRNYLDKYSGVAKEIISKLLDKYQDTDIFDIQDLNILRNDPFKKYGNISRIIELFGTKESFEKVLFDLSNELYANQEF